MTDANPEAEARAILESAGATGIRVEQYGGGHWLVACREFGAGVTSDKEAAFDTPQELAAHMVRFGMLADAGDEEQDSGYAEAPELHADHSEDAGSAGGAGSDFGGDHALPGDSGPGVDAAADEPLQAELADDPEPDGAPSVAIFGPEPDKLPLLKLFKHGQLSQVARLRKAALLGDWSLDELHRQQGQLARFARGELGAGPEAQAHFDMVAERINAVAAVDKIAEHRAMELDMLHTREAVDAFDPSEGLT